MLVGVQLANRALVERPADETAKVAGAEPGLVFEEEGVEGAVVAVEEGGFERCGLPSWHRRVEVCHR